MRSSTRQQAHVAKEATRIIINVPYTRKGHQWQSTFWEDVEGFEQDVVGGSKQKKANDTRIDT